MKHIPAKNSVLLAFIFGSGLGMSQNLIQNPSFEEYAECPVSLGNFNTDVRFWSTPTSGSTDYFNSCSKAMGTPENFNGKQPADFGEGYTGMYLYAPDDYREYIQVPLVRSLIKGETYRISFYVSLAERSDFAVREFGVLFSEKQLDFPIKKVLSKMHLYKDGNNAFNFTEIGYPNFYRDTEEWILVSTQYVAKGIENFMTIGNFKNNAKTHKYKTKRYAKQGAYYYIDMISLERANAGEIAQNSQIPVIDAKGQTFALDKVHTFKSVLFEFDRYELLEAAKTDIEQIYDYLRKDSSLFIAIDGHTDTIGTEHYNKVLSANRCNSVARYLMQMGLPAERISWHGHGGSKPVADNSTESGRKLNRRVEFIITSKKPH
ncbi:MAG TPA: OmpA family protein [Eudoraea sp.]|nr:OmpA family protein [Eudoraea sp.]